MRSRKNISGRPASYISLMKSMRLPARIYMRPRRYLKCCAKPKLLESAQERLEKCREET
jgi:hypothetical protein